MHWHLVLISVYRYFAPLVRTSCVFTRLLHVLRDGPLEKWWRGGGGGSISNLYDHFFKIFCLCRFFFYWSLARILLFFQDIFQDIKIFSGRKKRVKKIFRTNITLIKVQNTFSPARFLFLLLPPPPLPSLF